MDDPKIRVNIHNEPDPNVEGSLPSVLRDFFGANPGAIFVVRPEWGTDAGGHRVISRDLNSMIGSIEAILRSTLEHDKELVKDDSVQVLYEAVEAKEKGTCSICADEYPAGAGVASLICDHKFHGHCLTEWGKYKQDCPVCRRKIDYRFRENK